MSFATQLCMYMDELSCTAKYISENTGISMAQISRYRNGIVTPKKGDGSVEKIAEVLGELAKQNRIETISKEGIFTELDSLVEDDFDYDNFRMKLSILVDDFGVNMTSLASFCGYNVSTFSKVRHGKRNPRDPLYMSQAIANYISSKYSEESYRKRFCEISDLEEPLGESDDAYKNAIFRWLSTNSENQKIINSFVNSFSEFDMEEYLIAHHFARIFVPTFPIQFPVQKSYFGVKGMEDGVLAFLRTTATAPSKMDVILYSDFPLDEYGKHSKFITHFLLGVAALIKRGIRIKVIHNVNRPEKELLLGLEGWLPLYMTGLVTSYYLPYSEAPINHLLLSSGSASMVGSSINKFSDSGQYLFTKATKETAAVRLRSEQLLSNAKPLFRMLQRENRDEYTELLMKAINEGGLFKSVCTTPPIYTISDELLESILSHNHVTDEEAGEIRAYVVERKKHFKRLMKNGMLDQTLSPASALDFKNNEVFLALSGLFPKHDIVYTYDEYMAHIEETKKVADENDNYLFEIGDTAPGYHNVQVLIMNHSLLCVSREKSPAIHFVTEHSQLINIYNKFILAERRQK